MGRTLPAVVIALALCGCGAEPQPTFCALIALPAPPSRIEVPLRAMVVHADRDGTLRDDAGRELTGFPTDEAGVVVGERGPIRVPASVAGRPTTRVALAASLPGPGYSLGFNWAQPVSSSNMSTRVHVRDGLGHTHPIDVFFAYTAPGSWQWHAGTDGAEIEYGIIGAWSWLAEGVLVFDEDGSLVAATQGSSGLRFAGAPHQEIAFDFAGSELVPGTRLTDGCSSVDMLTSDDQPEGWLSSVAFDRAGRLTTTYSNGRRLHPARLAFAVDAIPVGLEADAGNEQEGGCALAAPVTLDVSAGGDAVLTAARR